MIIGIAIVSLASIATWFFYLRKVDIYETEKLPDMLFDLCIGAAVSAVYFLLKANSSVTWIPNDDFLMRAIYHSLISEGLIQEFVKLLPFFIIYTFKKERINEPLDVVIVFCCSALGFSFIQNVFFAKHEFNELMWTNSISSAFGHIIHSSIVAYGFAQYLFRNGYHKKKVLIGYFILGVLSHTFFTIWRIYYPNQFIGLLGSTLFFLFLVSVFINILNNCLNNSPFFRYDQVINPQKLSTQLGTYFGIIVLIQIILMGVYFGAESAIIYMIIHSIEIFIILLIALTRITRFKLMQNTWKSLQIELPFERVGYTNVLFAPLRLQVKGEGFNETFINSYLYKNCLVRPLSLRNSYLNADFKGHLEEKIFLDQDIGAYVLKIQTGSMQTKQYLLIPKTFGRSVMAKQYPIAALMEVENMEKLKTQGTGIFDLPFLEWVYLKPADWKNDYLKVGRVSDNS